MMAEYESGYVTESCRESVDDIVSGEDLGGDEFSVCFIFRVDSGLAANELVTAIKDGSFDKKKTCCCYSTSCRSNRSAKALSGY